MACPDQRGLENEPPGGWYCCRGWVGIDSLRYITDADPCLGRVSYFGFLVGDKCFGRFLIDSRQGFQRGSMLIFVVLWGTMVDFVGWVFGGT